MSYLLDTHALFWLVDPGYHVPDHLDELLGRTGTRLFVSSVTPFEISTKVRLGRFRDASWLLDVWREAMRGLPGEPLALTHEHAMRAGRLDWTHRDPFDRLLAGQALSERLTLVTADPAFDTAPGLDVLRW